MIRVQGGVWPEERQGRCGGQVVILVLITFKILTFSSFWGIMTGNLYFLNNIMTRETISYKEDGLSGIF